MKKANFCSNHLNFFHVNKKTPKTSVYLNTGLPLSKIEICVSEKYYFVLEEG